MKRISATVLTAICIAAISMAWGPRHVAAEPASEDSDSIAHRIHGRRFPSVFEAWNPAEDLHNDPNTSSVPLSSIETQAATTARHDLYWAGAGLGLKLAGNQQYAILSPEFTPESIAVARKNRDALLDLNPHMLILAELHYYSASANFLPPDSPFACAV